MTDESVFANSMPVSIYAEPGVKLPQYATLGAACMDVRANQCYSLLPGEVVGIRTGLWIHVPEGWVMRVASRSGLPINNKIIVANPYGAVDEDYKGEFKVILANIGINPFKIEVGDRIAQIDFHKVNRVRWVLAEMPDPNSTERGANGLGHTGLK